ncbi:hypothetical protein CKO15_09625 [Halorhodospira abdelmalekii]|uniref:dihydrofolate reductase n=1 Tax=Halorhodospira abdelmalekii TaxID=421629 RepID=UPI00190502FD|nr:dihydrofolate reductase [Halorhodospira abdelmalekii]MBK1735537.1 hypothetical protein [Halorhodospira abdelmalekii]
MSRNKAKSTKVVLIAIMGRNRVIGDGTTQPWHFRCDLRRFQALTRGHPLILGRRTFAAIGKPLPERTHIVLTHNPKDRPPGVLTAATIDNALQLAAAAPGGDEIFVIGGGTVYEQLLPYADRIELTIVDDAPAGTVHFPILDETQWQEESSESAAEAGYALRFVRLRRR